MTESMIEKGVQCVIDNCPGVTEDGARYAIVSFLLGLGEPSAGALVAGWMECPQCSECDSGAHPKEVFTAMIDHILNESGEGK